MDLARIDKGVVVERMTVAPALADFKPAEMFHPDLHWVDVSSQAQVAVGWHYDGTAFTAPAASA